MKIVRLKRDEILIPAATGGHFRHIILMMEFV